MPTTRTLAELFRALAAEDVGTATAVAARICTGEEQKGHRSAARLLRGALRANGSVAPSEPVGAPGAAHVLSTALVRLPTDVCLEDVVLTSSARSELEDTVVEWKHRDRLYQRGIAPRSKLFFHGPPGCGKSFTARALGKELGVPVYVVRFDAVIGAFLGQTAMHLRQLFHFAETIPCVLLLDELDALGKRRGSPLDVGELDRIVIALMQELEHSKPAGLIVGTSNMAKHLDDALWRRFDLTLLFKAPAKKVLSAFAKRVASEKRIKLPARVVRQAMQADSFASAESIVVAEARRQALRST